ncbi:unnamed protein product [Rotaria sp. Silwood2]|nr:unnamed protein product [Rotaria sp. Silwood2]CAF3152599.1 unnamed protein product [Rotaria sp. Silwood2]CAF3892201.1 unnamed protein product [Rotaria sp. Silwood2]CAF4620229.1 unnamed protein product [Rotaria sp. Silwood2]CAF4755343.1 unnamed protein product [Rotaria sp. Silwood2]
MEATRRLRYPRSSTTASTCSSTDDIGNVAIPVARPPRKLAHSGRPRIGLSEEEQENIRYHVHLTLAERIYPTTEKVLNRILADDPGFPIRSTTSLWRWMKKLGFSYKRTSKVVVPLDAVSFMASRARYFAAIDEARSDGSKIFWHDETWCNQNEEKSFVWTDGMTGSGRLRQSKGKGKGFF